MVGDLCDSRLESALHRALIGLALPTREVSAFIGDLKQYSVRRFRHDGVRCARRLFGAGVGYIMNPSPRAQVRSCSSSVESAWVL